MGYFTNLYSKFVAWINSVNTPLDLPENAREGQVAYVRSTGSMWIYDNGSWTNTAAGGGTADTFKTVQADNGTSPVASGPNDTLNITSNDESVITTGDSSTKTIDLKVDPTKGDLATALAGKQNSLGFTPEDVANKATNLTSPDNTKYPTTQAVATGLAAKQDSLGYTAENVANKATNLTAPDNTKYPTTQAVATGLATKQDSLTTAQMDQFDENWEEMSKERTDFDTGVWKTITWKDKITGNTRKISVLYGGTAPLFTTRQILIYQPDGVTLRRTEYFTQQYSGSEWIGEV